MYFLLNDVVLSLELQLLTPPVMARRFSALSLDCVSRLGREIFAEEPKLQHRAVERGRRLASLIISKAPQLDAALFVAPSRGCDPEQVAFRYAPGENPNGSEQDIAGVLNADGNVLGLMPHPEHAVDPLLGSGDGALVLASLVDAARERLYVGS